MGTVLIQLSPGLKYDKSIMNDFLNLLKENYFDYRFAIEIRHKSWINDDFFNLLAKYQIAFVIADSGERYPYYEALTTDFIYLRFHGHQNPEFPAAHYFKINSVNEEQYIIRHEIESDRWYLIL